MRIAFAAVVVLFVQAVGCGDEFADDQCSQVSCNDDPWCCPDGQTCAPDSNTSFACLNIGSGQYGDPCVNTIGSPQCGELLFCYQTVGSNQGVCTWYCDPTETDRACPNLHNCLNVTVGTAGNVSVCDPNAPPS